MINVLELVKENESIKKYNPELVEKFTKNMLSGRGIVQNPDVKGNNAEYSIIETFINNFEEKMLFLKIYHIIIKILEEKRRKDKTNYKNTQRTYKTGEPITENHVFFLEKSFVLPLLYETRHFLKSKFND